MTMSEERSEKPCSGSLFCVEEISSSLMKVVCWECMRVYESVRKYMTRVCEGGWRSTLFTCIHSYTRHSFSYTFIHSSITHNTLSYNFIHCVMKWHHELTKTTSYTFKHSPTLIYFYIMKKWWQGWENDDKDEKMTTRMRKWRQWWENDDNGKKWWQSDDKVMTKWWQSDDKVMTK